MGNVTSRLWDSEDMVGYRLPVLSDELVGDKRCDSDVFTPSEWISIFAEDYRIAIAFVETRLLNIIKQLKPRGANVYNTGLERMIFENTPTFMLSREIDQLKQVTEFARGYSVSREELVGKIIHAFADQTRQDKGLALKEIEDGSLVFVLVTDGRSESYF